MRIAIAVLRRSIIPASMGILACAAGCVPADGSTADETLSTIATSVLQGAVDIAVSVLGPLVQAGVLALFF